MKRVIKRFYFLLTIFLVIISSIYLISAITLDVTHESVSNTFIIDLNEPAVFDLVIRNLGDSDNFEIYSLVGVDISPSEPIKIESGETKRVRIKVIPQESLRVKKNTPFTFEYKIRNSKNEIQKETLSINILDLASIFSVNVNDIIPESEKTLLSIENNIVYDFSSINLKSSSIFFDLEQELSLTGREKKDFTIEIDREKLKKVDAGVYLVNSKITVSGKTANIQSKIKLLEQEGIEITRDEEGFIIKRTEIIKKNIGNVKKTTVIVAEKNLLSYLFTTANIPPTKVDADGFTRVYRWEKELIPNEEIKVIIRTNWLFPLIILIIILVGIILVNRSIYTNLVLRKKVSFIKTKGGHFALKVSIILRSKKYVERINVVDKLPPLVELYSKFGAIHPNKIDLTNKRLEWNISSLNRGETRVFTYIIYSKIGVFGRFELPEAKAFYEDEGRVNEIVSNRSFYVNEPKS